MPASEPMRFGPVARDLTRLLGVNVITRGLGIVALVIYARLLSPTELAAVPLFFILGSFVTVPLNLGLFPTLMREVPGLLERDRLEALGMIRTVALAVAGGVVLVAAGYAVFAPVLSVFFYGTSEWTWLIWWMIPGAIARGLDDVLTMLMRATREFAMLAEKKLVIELATPLLAVSLSLALGVLGLVIGLVAGNTLGVIWGAFRARSYLFTRAPAVRLWPLVRRSRAYYAESGVFFLINHGDQALVGALLTPAGLAGYYLARRIPDALALILLSVEEVMGPTLARSTAGPRADLHRMFRGFTLITAAFVLPAAVMAAAFAWAFITLVGQDTYGGVTAAIVVLSLGLTVQGAMTLVSQSALALGHPRDRLKLTALCGALLVAFTAATAPMGLTAVALGRVAALAVATLVGAYLLRHLLPPIPWADVLKLVGPAILAGAGAVGLSRLSHDVRLVPVYVILALAVWALSTLGVLSRGDRAELAQVWKAG